MAKLSTKENKNSKTTSNRTFIIVLTIQIFQLEKVISSPNWSIYRSFSTQHNIITMKKNQVIVEINSITLIIIIESKQF